MTEDPDYIAMLRRQSIEAWNWKRIKTTERNLVLDRLDTGNLYDIRGYHTHLGKEDVYLMRTIAKCQYRKFDRKYAHMLLVLGNSNLTVIRGTNVETLYKQLARTIIG